MKRLLQRQLQLHVFILRRASHELTNCSKEREEENKRSGQTRTRSTIQEAADLSSCASASRGTGSSSSGNSAKRGVTSGGATSVASGESECMVEVRVRLEGQLAFAFDGLIHRHRQIAASSCSHSLQRVRDRFQFTSASAGRVSSWSRRGTGRRSSRLSGRS